MKPLFSVCIICLVLFSCEKQDSSSPVFKAKYLGKGCWPVIQILEPLDARFAEQKWYDAVTDSMYSNCVGAGEVPEKYQNGRPFYFTIRTITQDLPYLTYCSPTKYLIGIEIISDTSFAK
jgi:hypothetical protein